MNSNGLVELREYKKLEKALKEISKRYKDVEDYQVDDCSLFDSNKDAYEQGESDGYQNGLNWAAERAMEALKDV